MRADENVIGKDRGKVTSWLAALANARRNGGQRWRVMEAIDRIGPATDEQIQEHLLMNQNTQRPRRVELVDWGFATEVDNLGRTRCGNRATRWALTDEGRGVLRTRQQVEARGKALSL